MRLLLFLLTLLQISPSIARPLLEGFTADYEVSKNGTPLGISHRQLTIRDQGKKLDYASTTIPTGIVALFVSDRFMEHSQMKLGPSGIKPIQYEYQRTGGKKEITFQARFDWQKRQISLSNQAEPQALLANSHDLLSFQIAMMQGLSQGVKNFIFQVVDHKRIQFQKLEFNRIEKMNTSMGHLDVYRLDHQADKSHYRFTFWCAKQLNFLPIKITKTEQDGDVIQLRLKRYKEKAFYLRSPSSKTK